MFGGGGGGDGGDGGDGGGDGGDGGKEEAEMGLLTSRVRGTGGKHAHAHQTIPRARTSRKFYSGIYSNKVGVYTPIKWVIYSDKVGVYTATRHRNLILVSSRSFLLVANKSYPSLSHRNHLRLRAAFMTVCASRIDIASI